MLTSSSLTNLDLYIFVVLISRVNTRKKALNAFSRAILQESISLESLKNVFSHVTVLEQHAHSLVMICQHLLILGTKSPRLLEWAIELFSSTFIHYPSARSEV